MRTRRGFRLLGVGLALPALAGTARAGTDVERWPARAGAPCGVVFEIVEADEDALQTGKRVEFGEVHARLQALIADGVPVHVCETHAGWYGAGAGNFSGHVDVVPTGPGQIRLYEEPGYELIAEY